MIPDSVCKADDIEPTNRHSFTVVRVAQQFLDQQSIRIGARIVFECSDLFGSRRKSDKVAVEATDQRTSLCSWTWGDPLFGEFDFDPIIQR